MPPLPGPDAPLRCLLVSPPHNPHSVWNYVAACEAVGAKTPSPPLGLLTVAAILPQHWEFRLLDLNVAEFSRDLWEWADIVCVGGMVSQRAGLVRLIDYARRYDKFIVVGGVDATSNPAPFRGADALVLGEGEVSIPEWLASWRGGEPRGVFRASGKADVTSSPVPRYDLLAVDDYYKICVQYSRGCPFSCEFCDIPVLFGRVSRVKTPEQFTRELDALLATGYRGLVDIVDDNFIGNKRNVKRHLLPALSAWNAELGRPFTFYTEASMNVADDLELLAQLRDAGFRYLFMGIETPDRDVLLATRKSQNTMRPIVDRIQRIYEHGMVVTASFIVGLDQEKPGTGTAMIELIEAAGINFAAIGLLVALPGTPLWQRLEREGRLRPQLPSELNFVTARDRAEILQEYIDVIGTVYEPEAYFARTVRTMRRLQLSKAERPAALGLVRGVRTALRIIRKLRAYQPARAHLARTLAALAMLGPRRLYTGLQLLAFFPHFHEKAKVYRRLLSERRERCLQGDGVPRSTADLDPRTGQAVA